MHNQLTNFEACPHLPDLPHPKVIPAKKYTYFFTTGNITTG
jgi:hypothetical protein